MAARSNALLSALASVVRLNPRVSAGLAFELGVMVGVFVKSARRRGLAGASAKLIEAMPVPRAPSSRRTTSRTTSRTAKRKAVAPKRKTAKRVARTRSA
jgi:hypothetical protein